MRAIQIMSIKTVILAAVFLVMSGASFVGGFTAGWYAGHADAGWQIDRQTQESIHQQPQV